jgi:hypothetical protein
VNTSSRTFRGATAAAVLAALVETTVACLADPPALPDDNLDAAGPDATRDPEIPDGGSTLDAPIGDHATPEIVTPDASYSEAATADGSGLDVSLVDAPVTMDADIVTSAELCAAEGDLAARCAPDGVACYAANEAQCTAFGAALSDAARRAYVACVPNVQCVTGYDVLNQTCVRRALDGVAPTQAQTRLRDDVCAACGGTNCAAAFFESGLTSAMTGDGFALLAYSDSVINVVDQGCIPDVPDASASDCMVRFVICNQLVIPTLLPADACKDGGP